MLNLLLVYGPLNHTPEMSWRSRRTKAEMTAKNYLYSCTTTASPPCVVGEKMKLL